MDETFEIFLACAPGLEPLLRDEAREAGFARPACVPGGVTFQGGWAEVWRANLVLRGASRVLARIGAFRAMHLAQLDKRARKMDWGAVLRRDVPVKVDATCRKSRIYHAKAAVQRVEGALTAAGITVDAKATLVLRARIEDDLCTFSVDTSGELLHKRGHKPGVGKAPMRETLAALFLRAAGYDGAMPVVDPMCGSGTFVIEAAEIALGLAPGRSRSFAFEQLASFDPAAWAAMKEAAIPRDTALRFYASRGQRIAAARGAEGPGDRQPAVWRADRQYQAALCAVRRFRTGAERALPRLAHRHHHQRGWAGQGRRASVDTGAGGGPRRHQGTALRGAGYRRLTWAGQAAILDLVYHFRGAYGAISDHHYRAWLDGTGNGARASGG